MEKPTLKRVLVALLSSLFFLRLPGLLPLFWKWVVVALILLFFLLPSLKHGLKGGFVAGFFSLAFAGLGQLYVREYGRGVIFIIIAVFAYMTTGYSAKAWVFNNILFIVSAIDAFSLGKRGIGIL